METTAIHLLTHSIQHRSVRCDKLIAAVPSAFALGRRRMFPRDEERKNAPCTSQCPPGLFIPLFLLILPLQLVASLVQSEGCKYKKTPRLLESLSQGASSLFSSRFNGPSLTGGDGKCIPRTLCTKSNHHLTTWGARPALPAGRTPLRHAVQLFRNIISK